MTKKKEMNYPTRDLFLETLVRLGGEYLIRSEVSTEYDIKFKYSECKFMANATNESYDVDNLLRLHSSISFQLLPNIPNIEEYVSGKLNQIISDQQWFIQKMESLIEQVLLSVEHDHEDAS